MKHRLLLAAASLALVTGLGSPTASVAQDRYCLQGRVWGYPGNC
ncbi:hypothetical protein ACVWWI_002312 [Bradyrhizobium sp. USDA 3686]|nr:hypothetical protein [Bradyrhizobium canariense]